MVLLHNLQHSVSLVFVVYRALTPRLCPIAMVCVMCILISEACKYQKIPQSQQQGLQVVSYHVDCNEM